MDAFGRTVTPIDEDAVAVGQKLLSIVLVKLWSISHSYVNPEHELRAAALLGRFGQIHT